MAQLAAMATTAALGACVVVADPGKMAPQTSARSTVVISQPLRVAEVVVHPSQYDPKGLVLKPEAVREAVLLTLRRTRLAPETSADRGELELRVVVRELTAVAGFAGGAFRAEVTMTYEIVDAGGRMVFSDAYKSEAGTGPYGGGAARAAEAIETSVKTNIALFIESLARRWPDAERARGSGVNLR